MGRRAAETTGRRPWARSSPGDWSGPAWRAAPGPCAGDSSRHDGRNSPKPTRAQAWRRSGARAVPRALAIPFARKAEEPSCPGPRTPADLDVTSFRMIPGGVILSNTFPPLSHKRLQQWSSATGWPHAATRPRDRSPRRSGMAGGRPPRPGGDTDLPRAPRSQRTRGEPRGPRLLLGVGSPPPARHLREKLKKKFAKPTRAPYLTLATESPPNSPP